MLSKILDRVIKLQPTTVWACAVGFSVLAWAGIALIGLELAGML